MCSDAPNMDGVNAAAAANAAISKEALDWYKQIYADTADDRARATELSLQQADVQNQLSQQQLQMSQEERARYKDTFQPIEQRIASDALAYDTPARREEAARAAVADSEIALSGQRDATMRDLARRGVNPASGRMAALSGTMDLGAAKMKASAANTARQRVETVGAAKMADAAALGRGVVSNNSTAAQIGLQAGNSSVGNAQVPLTTANQGAALMGQGFNTAIQGNASAGQMYGMAANAQSQDSGLWGALGTLGGAAISNWSDENLKEGAKPADGEIALAAVRKMPVKQWRYKKGSVADDGGKQHVGPMAQSVEKAIPGAVTNTPDGKQVDVVSLAGTALSAVGELDRRVRRVEQIALGK